VLIPRRRAVSVLGSGAGGPAASATAGPAGPGDSRVSSDGFDHQAPGLDPDGDRLADGEACLFEPLAGEAEEGARLEVLAAARRPVEGVDVGAAAAELIEPPPVPLLGRIDETELRRVRRAPGRVRPVRGRQGTGRERRDGLSHVGHSLGRGRAPRRLAPDRSAGGFAAGAPGPPGAFACGGRGGGRTRWTRLGVGLGIGRLRD